MTPSSIASPPVDLYGQETELALLAALRPHLSSPSLVDVGAERGGLAAGLLAHGYGPAHLIEPASDNVEALREALGTRPDVTVLPIAAGTADGEARLHLAEDASGRPLPAFNALSPPAEETGGVHWHEGDRVELRSLGSLVEDGTIPEEVGLLKVDTEGADRDVVAGMGALRCEALMLEHWLDIPEATGPCPWTLDELLELLEPRGLRRFAYVNHHGAATRVTFDRAEPEVGDFGNLVFMTDALHASAQAALELVAERAGALSDAVVSAEAKQGQIELLTAALDERSALLDESAAEADRLRAETDHLRNEADRLIIEIEELTADVTESRRYIGDLRGRINQLEEGVVIGGPVVRRLRRLERPRTTRLRHWRAPRLGTLRQHSPRPIRVPRRQLRLRLPANPPTIAIVTPSYDQGEFVERTIRSVLDQGYPALRYAVQDGGSNDGTRAILDEYRSRLTACASEPDDGQGDAINKGFERVDGEIMGWLNSDDVLLPGALAAVARHFANHPETDVVYGHRALIDDCDNQIGAWIMPPHEDGTLELVDFIPQETLFWRRRIWERAGGRIDPSFRYALDWDLLLRFLDAGARFERLPYVIGGFRVHPDQKTTGQLEVGLEEVHQIRLDRHGRRIAQDEAWELVQPYLRRHVVHHTLHQLEMRVPALRATL